MLQHLHPKHLETMRRRLCGFQCYKFGATSNFFHFRVANFSCKALHQSISSTNTSVLFKYMGMFSVFEHCQIAYFYFVLCRCCSFISSFLDRFNKFTKKWYMMREIFNYNTTENHCHRNTPFLLTYSDHTDNFLQNLKAALRCCWVIPWGVWQREDTSQNFNTVVHSTAYSTSSVNGV